MYKIQTAIHTLSVRVFSNTWIFTTTVLATIHYNTVYAS